MLATVEKPSIKARMHANTTRSLHLGQHSFFPKGGRIGKDKGKSPLGKR